LKITYLLASAALSGGLRIVIQQARELAARGQQVSLVCPDQRPDCFDLGRARWEAAPFASATALLNADIRIATFWTTVSPAIENFFGPVFHLCQGYEGDFSFYRSIRKQIESAYSEPTYKLAISPHITDRLKHLGYTPVAYIGQAFDPEEFPPAKERPFYRSPPILLVIGIFQADVKGVREALTALAMLRKEGVPFRLRRISPIPFTQEERSLIQADEYHLQASPHQMGQIYRNSDLFIGPSHPEEGFGLPALEAIASGLPALLSDTPGHRHIAGEAAAYFRCSDTADLASQCEALLLDAARRSELSRQGPQTAARFSTSSVVDKLAAIFREVLRERSKNSSLH